MFRILLFSLLTLSFSTSQAQTQELPEQYTVLMDWLTENSNAYSGILNDRQTWVVTYDGFQITDEYYWDNTLTVQVQFDIRDIHKTTNEIRFSNSLALYPEPDNTTDIQVLRFEEGMQELIEGDYYNLMIDPTIKKEAHSKMQEVLEIIKEFQVPKEE